MTKTHVYYTTKHTPKIYYDVYNDHNDHFYVAYKDTNDFLECTILYVVKVFTMVKNLSQSHRLGVIKPFLLYITTTITFQLVWTPHNFLILDGMS